MLPTHITVTHHDDRATCRNDRTGAVVDVPIAIVDGLTEAQVPGDFDRLELSENEASDVLWRCEHGGEC